MSKIKKEKCPYYRLDNILKYNATYNIVMGERSNGKTFAVKEYGLKDYTDNGVQLGLVRRWRDDFIGGRGESMFSDIVEKGLVSKYTNGQWNNITYKASKWYLSKWDDDLDKMILDSTPFAIGFAVSTGEHDKSTSYPNIKNVLFDEFLTREHYLKDEFILFENTLSTIIREKDDVKIFMCGNTVDMFSPYFQEMGLSNIRNLKKGEIQLYTYGDSGLTVAVEFSDFKSSGKKSDKYFAFNNPKLKMITDGSWEIDLYPHLPKKYFQKDILLTYFIKFQDYILQCEIISIDNMFFTYIHRKTTPIKDDDNDIIFEQEYSIKQNHYRGLYKSVDIRVEKILYFFKINRVFYQDNEVGEMVKSFMEWSRTNQ